MTTTKTIKLPETLTIANAAALLDDCISELEEAASVLVDASSVRRIDTACLQVLLSLRLAASERDLNFEWVSASAPFLDAAHLLGLKNDLGLQSLQSDASNNR